jgi:hypothetical protein
LGFIQEVSALPIREAILLDAFPFPFDVDRDADSDSDETGEVGRGEGEVRIKELNKSSSPMVDEAAIGFRMLW